MESLAVSKSANLLWISTTHTCNKGTSHKESDMFAFLSGRNKNASVNWKYLDLFNITRDLVVNKLEVPPKYADGKYSKLHTWLRIKCSKAYVDSIGHFQPYFYREFAKAILSMTC
eukprot:TRINITY_DN30646_c0_g1_i1.p1 TRINITY_DN30646_c0_g1~~TRINITY_DN30646_c0_g1_i1.p1  ORF type:complete len:130 (+),score=22.87 TRINITY_DN30646_c0_g1_i1:48-392(+)